MLTLPYDFAETPVRVSQCDLAMWFASAITLANVMWKEAFKHIWLLAYLPSWWEKHAPSSYSSQNELCRAEPNQT